MLVRNSVEIHMLEVIELQRSSDTRCWCSCELMTVYVESFAGSEVLWYRPIFYLVFMQCVLNTRALEVYQQQELTSEPGLVAIALSHDQGSRKGMRDSVPAKSLGRFCRSHLTEFGHAHLRYASCIILGSILWAWGIQFCERLMWFPA